MIYTGIRRLLRPALTLAAVLIPMVVAGGAVHSAPATPSASKLSIHLIANYTSGAKQIIDAHPRVLKILDLHETMLQAARDYKASTPGGIVVLRIYTPHRYTLADNPQTAADHFWNSILLPPISKLSASDRALIDYVEGPNEGDSTPTWGSPAESAWYNAFWLRLAPHIANAGFRPCAYSISVGNPPGTQAEIRDRLDRIVPSLRLIQSLGGAWSYHPYTIQYTKDPGVELWYSLRYRQYYAYFSQKYPDIANIPMIFTEGGVDGQVSPDGAGWKGGGSAEKFQDWLAWWDGEIRKDRYVIGATLFQIGDVPGWGSFDLEPIAPWLANHLSSLRATGTAFTAKTAPTGSPVNIAGGIVADTFDGFFYAMSPDRSSGIRVQMAGHGLAAGDTADVYGRVQTNAYGERYIDADTVFRGGWSPVDPFLVAPQSIGGADLFTGQTGVAGGIGLNNVGLYVRTWGRVEDAGNPVGTFRLSAPSWPVGTLPLRVTAPGVASPAEGALVAVQGPVSLYRAPEILPQVLVSRPDNIEVLAAP